jgi:anaerobic selenocysteine-containing dehydrogenase
VVPPDPSERQDWEIVTELAARTLAPRGLRRAARAIGQRLTPERLLDVLLRLGPHRLSVSTLRQHPHGLDLGPLEPGRFRARIATPDRMADAAPQEFVREARVRFPELLDRGHAPDLVLIGRRQLRDKNSWLHNSPRLAKGPPRCTLLVHSDDAARRCLVDGDLVRLESAAGAVTVPVQITDAVRAGVVSLPHGWGQDRDGVRLRVARAQAAPSVNDVTREDYLDTLSGNAAFNGVPVTLAPIAR